MLKALTGVLIITLLAACSMPETRIYSLHLSAEDTMTSTTGTASLKAPVVISTIGARHLFQPYIIYKTSPYKLGVAHYAKWDRSPDKIITESMQDAVSGKLFSYAVTKGIAPKDAYKLEINLKKFGRIDDGNISFAELAFTISLESPSGQQLYRGRYSRREQLDDTSFIALTKGLGNLVDSTTAEAVVAIASAVNK